MFVRVSDGDGHHRGRSVGASTVLLAIAGAVAITLTLMACHRESPQHPEPSPAPRVALAVEPPVFTAAEEKVLGALATFYGGLLDGLRDPGAAAADPDAAATRLRAHLDPVLPEVLKASADYRALPAERRRLLHQEGFRRNADRVVELMTASAGWAEQFRPAAERPRFRRVVEKTLGAWKEKGALWVVAGFGEDAVEEIGEWASGREEGEGKEGEDGSLEAAPVGNREKEGHEGANHRRIGSEARWQSG